jgi:hypothetical protein
MRQKITIVEKLGQPKSEDHPNEKTWRHINQYNDNRHNDAQLNGLDCDFSISNTQHNVMLGVSFLLLC